MVVSLGERSSVVDICFVGESSAKEEASFFLAVVVVGLYSVLVDSMDTLRLSLTGTPYRV